MNARDIKATLNVSLAELSALVGTDYGEDDQLHLAMSALSQGGRELCVLAYLAREDEITGDDLKFILWRLGERLKGTAAILSGYTASERGQAEEARGPGVSP